MCIRDRPRSAAAPRPDGARAPRAPRAPRCRTRGRSGSERASGREARRASRSAPDDDRVPDGPAGRPGYAPTSVPVCVPAPPADPGWGAPERRRAPTSERSQGAQPGHPGRGRHLAPIETLNELLDHWPARCRCGHVFRAAERAALGAPARHQVAELPPTAVILSEHRLQRLRCPDCGATTRAELPAGVPRGAFGPRLQAAVVTLAVRNRVSRRDTTELLRELFGARLSAGSV